jgi:hypothetical protein
MLGTQKLGDNGIVRGPPGYEAPGLAHSRLLRLIAKHSSTLRASSRWAWSRLQSPLLVRVSMTRELDHVGAVGYTSLADVQALAAVMGTKLEPDAA